MIDLNSLILRLNDQFGPKPTITARKLKIEAMSKPSPVKQHPGEIHPSGVPAKHIDRITFTGVVGSCRRTLEAVAFR